jgi:hypothetical protein
LEREIMMNRLALIAAALAAATLGLAQTSGHKMDMARYGGPAYMGAPALSVTSSFLKAGGGAANFSIAKALTSMVGQKTVKAELGKLSKQYGKDRVGKWVAIFDYAVADAVKHTTAAKVKLPVPSLSGKELAATMVKASMDKDGTVYTELLLDKALTHGIHGTVMDDIDKKFSPEADLDFHRITNQALYDLAVAFKIKGAKLAKLH